MSAARELAARVGARLVDRANPMLVRHVRQQLRSKMFMGVYGLTLATAAICSVLFGSQAGQHVGNDAGRDLFVALAIVWSFTLWVAEPLAVFRAVVRERDDETWDLIRLTGMHPHRVLRGILQAALVQSMLFTAAIAPFMAMAYLLRGLSLIAVLVALVMIPLCGIAAGSGAMFAACLGTSRQLRAMLGALFAVVCVLTWFVFFQVWDRLGELALWADILALGRDDAALALGFALNFWAGFVLLMVVLSAALLTSPSANRSTGPRLVWYLAFFNGLPWLIGLAAADGHLVDGFALAALMGAVLTFLLGVFSVTEDYELTPRQARVITGARPWWRLPLLLFGPGAARGRLAYLALVAATATLVVLGFAEGGARRPLVAAWLTLCYGSFYLLLGDTLARGPFKRLAARPRGRRVVVLLVLAAGSLLATLIPLIAQDADNPLLLLSPLPGVGVAVEKYGAGGWPTFAISLVGVGSMLVLFVQGLRLKIEAPAGVPPDPAPQP